MPPSFLEQFGPFVNDESLLIPSGYPDLSAIAGMIVDHRADKGVTYNGSNKVSVWSDQASSGNHLANGAGAEPTYVPSRASFGGKPAILFETTGTHDGMVAAAASPPLAPLHGGAGTTWFVCFEPGARTDATLQLFWGTSTTAGSQHGCNLYYVGSTQLLFAFAVRGVGATFNSGVAAARSTAHWAVVRHATGQVNNLQMFVDQIASPDVNVNYTGTPSSSDPSTALTIGRRPGGVDFGFDGHVARISGWNRLLTDAELGDVQKFAANEWGL